MAYIYSPYDKQVMKVCMKEVFVAHRKVSKKIKIVQYSWGNNKN